LIDEGVATLYPIIGVKDALIVGEDEDITIIKNKSSTIIVATENINDEFIKPSV
jgi:hypothetical protein